MTATDETTYANLAFEDIPKVVSVLETEICDMLSDTVLHPAKLRRTLEARNSLIARYERRLEENMAWAEEVLKEREKRAGQVSER